MLVDIVDSAVINSEIAMQLLLSNFSDFYLRPIYLFKNSTHIFDKEDTIEAMLSEFIFYDGDRVLKPCFFEDSKDNLYIQASDIFVGLVGKLSAFINTHSQVEIEICIQKLRGRQLESLDMYLKLVKKCENKNRPFHIWAVIPCQGYTALDCFQDL